MTVHKMTTLTMTAHNRIVNKIIVFETIVHKSTYTK
jgi:hypothetical protein